MATRLSVRNRKRRRDQKTAYEKGKAPTKHKIGETRSKRAKKRLAYPMC